MQSSRQSDYTGQNPYGSHNIQMNNTIGNGSNYYGGASQHYGYGMEKQYYTVTTEPVVIDCNLPLVIVDPPVEEHVKSYTTWSIFNIFCCCFIGGVVTLFMACRVRVLNDTGNFKEARKLSAKVLLANMIITGLGALIFLIAFPYTYMAIYPYLPKINW